MKLEVNELTFGYDTSRSVFRDLSFRYDSPEVLCILGSNGCGKSTLLRCLIGEYTPQRGSVAIDGQAVRTYSARKLAHKLAYIAQSHTPAFGFRILDIVTMGRTSQIGYLATPSKEDREIAMENLEYLNIAHLRNKPYTDISGGERQLVMIAAALTQEPECLILDEPTAHLDFGNQYRFLQLVERLRARGMGVIMTTHFPDHALKLGGRTLLLKDGGIVADGAAHEVITDPAMEALYRIEVHVKTIGSRRICVPGSLSNKNEMQ